MPITVRNEFELQVTTTNVTVVRLKQLVERRMHIPAALQSLFFNGMELQDDGTLVQFGVDLNSTLFLIVRGDGNQENPLLLNEDDEQGPDDAVGHFDETHGYGFNISDPYHQMPWNGPLVNHCAPPDNGSAQVC
ncbi:hypothetical protein M0R45_015170 [Rubus argutus]|uniref:Ubiquitin-like domain-containing protein n=1 Tax=Rubus argutus TaxID=59490 RepID=A0AAW1XNG4_RUBAR